MATEGQVTGKRRGRESKRERIEKLALKIGQAYLDKVRSYKHLAAPWNTNLPLQHTPVFIHFVKTAAILIESPDHLIEPRHWIAAQFEGLSWVSKHKIPWPAQLHTDSARMRYIEYMAKRNERDEVLAKPEHMTVKDPFHYERVKVQALSRRFGMTPKQVMRLCADEFTRGFHEQMGSWDDVKDSYEE